MRTIKFRGIPFDWDQFIYGSYVEYKGTHYIYTEMYEKATHLGILSQVQVDPKTVGQFTGLLDKHGKEIYEGNVTQTVSKDGIRLSTFEIQFNPGTARFRKIRIQDDTVYDLDFRSECMKEIIGNIHENPELLKG